MLITFILLIVVVIAIFIMNKPAQAMKKMLPGQSKKQELFKISIGPKEKNTMEFTIELNEERMKRRIKDGSLFKKTGPKEKTIQDIAGFYGMEAYSPNKQYCLFFANGYFNSAVFVEGMIALIRDKKLLFKRSIRRPHDCHVSNNGIVICSDWLTSSELTGIFLVFDISGGLLFERVATANLG